MPSELRNLAAESIYRDAWYCWLFNSCPKEKAILEQVMDEQQPKIGTNPKDPRWQRFADSLPGYRAFWSRFGGEAKVATGGL
jgi:hypothetical protein